MALSGASREWIEGTSIRVTLLVSNPHGPPCSAPVKLQSPDDAGDDVLPKSLFVASLRRLQVSYISKKAVGDDRGKTKIWVCVVSTSIEVVVSGPNL